MAIIKTVNIPRGINIALAQDRYNAEVLILNEEFEFRKAYIFIARIENTKGNVLATIGYKIDRDSPTVFTEILSCTIDIESSTMNDHQQVYTLMKEMDKFKDAIDVLEVGQVIG